MNAYNQFRVRRGWFGKAILQQLKSFPTFAGGHVDTTVRSIEWVDVSYDHAPVMLVVPESTPEGDRK